MLRSRLCYIFGWGSILACLPWLVADHRGFESRCVSNAHRAFEQKCSQCHDRSFVPLLRMVNLDNSIRSTSDAKCQVCHIESSSDHLVSSVDHARSSDSVSRMNNLIDVMRPKFDSQGCASCHDEHRGQIKLAEVSDGFCVSCHVAVDHNHSQSRFQLNFVGFSGTSEASRHPEFGIWRKPVAGNEPPSDLVTWNDEHPRDKSAIRFSHHRHLDPQLPKLGGETTTLACADCHQAEASGASFRPIQFEQHCHRCHKLGFPSTGELPHAKPEVIRDLLLGAIVKQFGTQSPLPQRKDELGGPTKSPLPSASDASTQSGNLEQRVEQALTDQLKKLMFNDSDLEVPPDAPRPAGLQEAACTKCHLTRQTEGASAEWTVLPPEIPPLWMPNSHFRHDRHLSVSCDYCHTRGGDKYQSVDRKQFYPVLSNELTASTSIYASRTASDLLLPKIEACRQCHHDGTPQTGQSSVGDSCVHCHKYHHTPSKAVAKQGIVELFGRQPASTGKSEVPAKATP